MPIYEYACQKCQSPLEILQKISDKPLTKCPKCGGKLEKQWSQTSFQLKGSGWYVTDYARKGAAAADAKDKNETGAATADAETKPAAAATETAPIGGEKKDDQKKAKKGKSPATTSSGKD
jgi:putative FmdB family regulatory protein